MTDCHMWYLLLHFHELQVNVCKAYFRLLLRALTATSSHLMLTECAAWDVTAAGIWAWRLCSAQAAGFVRVLRQRTGHRTSRSGWLQWARRHAFCRCAHGTAVAQCGWYYALGGSRQDDQWPATKDTDHTHAIAVCSASNSYRSALRVVVQVDRCDQAVRSSLHATPTVPTTTVSDTISLIVAIVHHME